MAGIHSPLCPLLNEINSAAQNGMQFVAIITVLALPDICISLASPDGRSNGERYKQWCNDNLRFPFLRGDDLWSMRCGVLHNGRFGDLKHSVARVIFQVAKPGDAMVKNCQIGDVYVSETTDFCKSLTDAVHRWMEIHLNDATVQANLPRLMQYRKGGFPPYVSAPMVLA